MALNSNPVKLGMAAPDFTLRDPGGSPVSLAEARGQNGTLIAFICNHCPYVHHIRAEFARYATEFSAKGIRVIAINSNDVNQYPVEAPEKMAEEARTWGYSFPYLVDADQTVARAYDAACTPDLYLFDADLRLYYHGQFDATRPNQGRPATGADLRAASEALLAGAAAPRNQSPSVGCSIKWKPGNAPGE